MNKTKFTESAKKGYESTSSSFPYVGVFTTLFVALKLTEQINWSWWWVLSPLWIVWAGLVAGIVAFFGVFAILLAIAGIGDWISKGARRRRIRSRS